MSKDICPICGLADIEETQSAQQDASVITCKRCGKYMIDGLTLGNFRSMHAHGAPSVGFTAEDVNLLPYLAAYTRQTYESGGKAQLDSKNWRGYARQHSNTPEEQKLHKLLALIQKRTQITGHNALLNCDLDYPCIDAASLEECKQLLDDLKGQNLLEYSRETAASYAVTITPSGRRYLEEISSQADEVTDGEAVQEASRYEYISQERLAELKALHPANFDLRRLIRLCEEIDSSYRNECWHAVAALTREVLDHVPPIFNKNTFSEVANNYGGGRSFKGSMQHLENSSRRIADMYLHTQIRRSESLPTSTQVNFANDLDVLLGEIVRTLK